jgi:hypothetical protein
MNTKRVWSIVGELLFWAMVVAFFVVAGARLRSTERERRVQGVEVILTDSLTRGYISAADIHTLLRESGLNPVGEDVDSVSLREIKALIEGADYATEVNTYVNFEGIVTIELSQLAPQMRICTSDGHDFYLTEELDVLPIQEGKVLNLPIVTGTLPLPFEKGFTGNIKGLSQEDKKNYEENYNFLSKLVKFVDLTENNPKYRGKIVQITATTHPQNGNGKWHEPTFEIVPLEGNYVVEIGTLDDVESKLQRWQRFTEARVVALSGGTLNVEYEGQAIWKPLAKEKKKRK